MTAPRRGTGCRLGLIGYSSILRDLQLTPMTAEALSVKHGLTMNRAHQVLRALRTVKLARVLSWEPRQAPAKGHRAVWTFGGAQDARHPCPTFERFGERSNNLNLTVITLSHLFRELVRSTCLSRLVEVTGCDHQVLSRWMAHCQAIGLCHLSRWDARLGGQTALWRLGDRPSAPKPPPKPRNAIDSESKARRKIRSQQQATFKVLAQEIARPFGGLLP